MWRGQASRTKGAAGGAVFDCFLFQYFCVRSLWHFNKGTPCPDLDLAIKRKELHAVILSILCRNSNLYYFQGFHDVVSVFLLVLDDPFLAFAVAELASKEYFIDCMQRDFEIASKIITLVMTIIQSADQMLFEYLTLAGVSSFFATSWMITWLAHDVKRLDDCARMFDAMLCSPPVFSIYVCAAVRAHLLNKCWFL